MSLPTATATDTTIATMTATIAAAATVVTTVRSPQYFLLHGCDPDAVGWLPQGHGNHSSIND